MARALWEICEQEYFPLNLKIRSEKTRHQYSIAVRCFERALGHQPTLDDLHDDAITRWMGKLLNDVKTPLSVHTVRERVNRVLALWAWLARRCVVRKWPTVIKPEAPESLPQALTEDQLRRLFRSAAKERGHICGVPADLWWTSYFGFVWCTAERKGAVLATRVQWLDLDRGTAAIPPASRKGGRKWGVYPLWPELLPLLKTALSADPTRELMWPWPKCDGSYYVTYGRILRDASIPADRRHKTHCLRVSHATWLKALGGDPTRKLMHSDPSTTNRHYIDPRLLPPDPTKLFIPWNLDFPNRPRSE